MKHGLGVLALTVTLALTAAAAQAALLDRDLDGNGEEVHDSVKRMAAGNPGRDEMFHRRARVGAARLAARPRSLSGRSGKRPQLDDRGESTATTKGCRISAEIRQQKAQAPRLE